MSTQTWIRVTPLADQLGLTAQAVRNLIHAGKLDADKDPEGRWLIDVASAAEYLANHGRHKPATVGLEAVERKLEELARDISELRELNMSTSRLLDAVERERDRYRVDASTTRAASLSLLGASRETRSVVTGLLASLQQQEDALVQLLAPGSPEELTASRGRGT